MPSLVFLWTDVLLWILVVLTVITILYSRKRRHLAEPWKSVFRSRVAVGSLVVLMSFISIGLLDSIHFRGAGSSTSTATRTRSLHLRSTSTSKRRRPGGCRKPTANGSSATSSIRIRS